MQIIRNQRRLVLSKEREIIRMKKYESFLVGVCVGGVMGAFITKKWMDSKSSVNVKHQDVTPQKEEIDLDELTDELERLSQRVDALQ